MPDCSLAHLDLALMWIPLLVDPGVLCLECFQEYSLQDCHAYHECCAIPLAVKGSRRKLPGQERYDIPHRSFSRQYCRRCSACYVHANDCGSADGSMMCRIWTLESGDVRALGVVKWWTKYCFCCWPRCRGIVVLPVPLRRYCLQLAQWYVWLICEGCE